MKKKIVSVLASIMLLLCPFILSACGDRYENMEFHISYAFSEDSSNWLDATNGISVTYGGEDDQLIIGDNLGYGVIYVRVEIANVNAKYIDDIIVTTSGVSSGLNFSSATVKQNQVFALRIRDNVSTNLRFYETNSGRTTNVGLSVSRSLTGIEVDTSIKPAVVVGDNVGLALMQVNNLTYLPANKTDQTGVRYSIESVGGYVENMASGENTYVATSLSSNYISITEGGVLRVASGFTPTASTYVVRIRATSLYNEEIYAEFDVYILDRITNTDQSLYAPTVQYARTGNAVTDMTLYVGSTNYNNTQITIDYSDFTSVYYSNNLLTIDGSISYGVAVYIDDQPVNLEETETINDLMVENRNGVLYITAIDSEIRTNTLRFALELNGVKYFTSSKPNYSRQITLTKETLPTSIRVNGEIIEDGGTANGMVYSTSADYAGLELTLSVFPENSSNDYLTIEGVNGSLSNLNITGNTLEYVNSNTLGLRSGETIRILFNENNNVSDQQSILIRVPASPSTFEGNQVNVSEEERYVEVTYVLDKVITADSINVYAIFSNGQLSNPIHNTTSFINARATSSFYVQVFYTGTVLDASTVTLYSSNDAVLFSNRSNTISLNDPNVQLVANSVRDAQGNVYNIYRVDILPVAPMETSQINISAGDENITVGAEFEVSSVYVLDEDSLSLSLSNSNAMEIIPNDDNNLAETNNQDEAIKYYAVVKDGHFDVRVVGRPVGAVVNSDYVIDHILLTTNNDYSSGNFSMRAITYTIISDDTFSVVGNLGGRTQVLTLTVYYYTTNSVGLVEQTSKNIQIEFAVYDPIQSISLTANQTDITYINSQFEDASSAEITVRSSASSAIPSSSVIFSSGNVEHASQLRLRFNRQLDVSENISVSFITNGETVEFDLNNSANGFILRNLTEQDVLNGVIVVSLMGDTSYSSLTLIVEALRFGESSNVVQTITINFADYEYVEGVEVLGNNIVNEGVDSNYLYMTFRNVADGGYAESTFTARARYNTTEPQDGRLRFGNLTYVLYQVDQNNDGSVVTDNGAVVISSTQRERLNVLFSENGTVTIRADKLLGGGVFKLVIVPEDAYNDETHTYDETRGTSLFISISDGTRQNPYVILNEEELRDINNDLNASYVLGGDIVISGEFSPIGTITTNVGEGNEQTTVSQFNGTLAGTRQTLDSNNNVVSSVRYSITLMVGEPIGDSNNAYAGLFTILGENAEISNLDLIVSYADTYNYSTENGSLFIGALVGVNNGSISGVSLIVNGTTNITSTTATYLGGLVGRNNGVISLDAECVEFNNVVLTTSNSNTVGLNVGLVAGINAGEISGNYVDKVGLNNIVFNVISNLTIYSNANDAVINVGGIAGENHNGVIRNLLIGGSIEVQNNTNCNSTGYVGGVVGVNSFSQGENSNDKYIDSCTVIGLDLISSSTGISLAGIAGSSSGYTIKNVRFISANITFNSARTTVGKIEGAGVVAGIVANSQGDTIEYASLQNFVSGVENNGVVSDFYTLSSTSDQVYSLVNGSTSTISNSFVQVNIAVNNSTSTIYLTSNATETGTYFLGKVQDYEGTTIHSNAGSDFNIVYTDNAMYSIVNNTANEIVLTNDEEEWINVIKANTKVYNGNNLKSNYAFENGGVIIRNNNIQIQGLNYYFPYLLKDNSPLMIIQPNEISADINENYVIEINSIYVDIETDLGVGDNNITFVHSAIINYHNSTEPLNNVRLNTYNLVNTGSAENENGLIDVSVLPVDATSGLRFEIVSGMSYAYINNEGQIVFTGVSGGTPIIVRAYSAFDDTVEAYIAFYTYFGLTDITITSNDVEVVVDENEEADYELTTFVGNNPYLITLEAENIYQGNECSTLFDLNGVDGFVSVEFEGDYESVIDIQPTLAVDAVRLGVREDAQFDGNRWQEDITIKLIFNLTRYFGEDVYPQISGNDQTIEIERMVLRVIVFKSATAVEINESGFVINTEGNLNFNASLYTGYVQANSTSSSAYDIDHSVNSLGIVSLNSDTNNKDSIALSFEITSGENEANRLMSMAEVNHFAELFDYNFAWQVIESSGLIVGYNYTISMSLKDEFNYRYITSEIEFTLTVSAWSNSGVNDSITITLTPTTLSTARIENYTATDVSSNNSYINLITSSSTETSIIAPGGFGGVMLIYLEPAYSNIIFATLTSSTLFVPSLNRDVRINFEQLVYNTDTGNYQTILSGAEPVEGGIQLRLVSTINNRGEESYNGVIYVHTQLDRFSGLSSTISATLTVETGSTANPTVSVTKQLLTRYLPGASLSYDGVEIGNEGNEYIIQEDTYSNIIDINIYGYQFNSQPNVSLEWYLNDTTKFTYGSGDDYYSPASSSTYTDGRLTEEEFNEKFDYLFTLSNGVYVKLDANATYDANVTYYEPANRGIIYDVSDTTYSNPYYISNYVTARIDGNYADLSPNADGSYSMQVLFNVQPDTPTSFRITASQSLTTDESEIITERSESLIFHPVEAVLNDLYFANLNNNTMNLVINHSNTIDFAFVTDDDLIDLNAEIYAMLLESFTTKDEQNNNVLNAEAFVSQFQFVNSAGTIVQLTTNEIDASTRHPQFSVRVVNNQLLFTGLETFNGTIEFSVHYGYVYNAENGKYELTFGAMNTNSLNYSIDASFNLIIVPSTSETNAIPIYSASDMVDENGNTRLVEGTDYILMNDITLDLVRPIDVAIASFDGNNRVIKINSFAVSSEQTNYGLFARIGTYTRNDQEEKTILKNIIVDYSGFNADNNGILSLVGLNNVTFGGLVAVNEGGLIYNCDVMNLSNTTKTINLVTDASMQNLTFGGLVGENNGTITNSRVGRMNYTRIEADETSQTERVVNGEALMFVVGDNTSTDTQTANGFVGVTGGFVGSNLGVIASSYMANTSLINLSTADSSARTAGFAGTNSGTINYSYVKAREDTISYNSPSATGAYIRAATNGNVAGFVHENSGTITNSFANTELITTSAFMAGFVYQNNATGVISECYAACTLNGSNNALDVSEQPFVGIDEAGTLLSNGEIENSYFLISDNYSEIVEQDGKAQAVALNTENFIDSDMLTGFVFINSNSQTERNQGVWTYYLGNTSVVLPELTNANTIAHSYRYLVDVTDNEDYTTYNYTNAINYAEGSANNPYIIRDVNEFNEIMTRNSTESNRSMTGYVRFIDDIDFASNSRAIQTRVNFILGDEYNRAVTSIEGNGMNISGIYLDVLDATSATDIGLFARVENAYIKNLNLNFVSTNLTDDQFSSVSVQYSGGLAGRINNSAIINISLNGSSTTIAGRNFAGGLAGVITGSSMIYGIDTNLSVKAVNTDYNYYMYYNEDDFNTMKGTGILSYGAYSDYLANLSYAGGVAGVIDIVERNNIEFNLSYINVLGTEMYDRSQANGNIQADYAGGVAGYMNDQTNALRVKFIVGTNNLILGQRATGGLFAVAMGSITASQVSAPEDTQYDYDTAFGTYVTDLRNGVDAVLDDEYGNLGLLEGYGYVGGLAGISIGTRINSSYSKASIRSGAVVGGLLGTSYASTIVYSYAVPYIDLEYSPSYYRSVGGLIGSAYGVRQIGSNISRNNQEYEAIAQRLNNIINQDTNVSFTFSTILLDNESSIPANATFDYISADYSDGDQYLTSNNSETLAYVFAGLVSYDMGIEGSTVQHSMSHISNNINLDGLFDIYGTNIEQETIFYSVFSGWSEEYWTLDSTRYYPLLLNRRVSNYIDIETADDFYKILNDETGNFRIVNDIDMTDWCQSQSSNFILDIDFQGVLIGEKADGTGTPRLYGLTINARQSGNAGFFRATTNATIRNIIFDWGTTDEQSAIEINNQNVEMVGMVSSSDNGSLFSNLIVRNRADNNITTSSSPYIINSNQNAISGFGGIIGSAINSNILNCSYTGDLSVPLSTAHGDATVGGLVGYAQRDTSIIETDEDTTNMTITSSYVGTSDAKTTFNFTIPANSSGNVYIGGLVGEAIEASISSVRLGSPEIDNDNQSVDIIVNLQGNPQANINVSGAVARSQDSALSSADILASITVSGTQTADTTETVTNNVFVAGLIADLNSTGASANAHVRSVSVVANLDFTNLSVNKLNASLGVAYVSNGNVSIESSLFTGKVNSTTPTDEEIDQTLNNAITSFSYGGIVAETNENTLTISECMVYTNEVEVGSTGTDILYAGGLVGNANQLIISDSISAGRLYPSTRNTANEDVTEIYVGGLVARAQRLQMNECISLESVFTNEISNGVMPYIVTGALYAQVENSNNVTLENVYYSSDLALVTQTENVGRNIAANLLINQPSSYISEFNSNDVTIWREMPANSGDLGSVPYIASLEQQLINYSIINVTSTGYRYLEGSVLEPYLITSNATFGENYEYYLLSSNLEALPSFTPENNAENPIFTGFIIGGETDYTINSNNFTTANNYRGFVAQTSNRSAISNIHINLVSTADNTVIELANNASATVGLIVGLNQGVVYNSSVQGTGLTISSEATNASVGLIVGANQGFISNCYSSAEILNLRNVSLIAGIVAENNGSLQNSYFTGYINNQGTTAAGIIGEVGVNSYVYNSYMGGVIENLSPNGNSFYASLSQSSDFVGSNNFIDRLANIEVDDEGSDALQYVDSLVIMRNSSIENAIGLEGNWYSIFNSTSSGGAIETEYYYINPTAPTYGYNYGYPVWNDHKLTNSNGDWQLNPTGHQLYTGTGSNTARIEEIADVNIAPNIDNFLSSDSVNVNNEYSNNVYKIPHLGVLSSIQGLTFINASSIVENSTTAEYINTSLNYMLIYDIDGQIDNNSNFAWSAIGRRTNTNFEGSSDWYYALENGNRFNGLFISNKNYTYTGLEKDNLENVCTITNLANSGIFTNINNAYFGYINFGNFTNLDNSGALGSLVNTTSSQTETEGHSVVVQNVYFYIPNRDVINTIQGNLSDFDINEEIDTSEIDNYVGGLFGEIRSGNVYIDNVRTAFDVNTASNWQVSVALSNANFAGLIAGVMSGGQLVINNPNQGTQPPVTEEEGEVEGLSVQFANIGYAGGLIGTLTGGEIQGNDIRVNLHAFDADQAINTIGGIIGYIGDGITSNTTVDSVLAVPSISSEDTMYIKNFGGLVGQISGDITLTDCGIVTDQESNIYVVDPSSYFGLITSRLTYGTATITGFSHEGEGGVRSFSITGNSITFSDESGFGVLIGKTEGESRLELTINEALNTSLTVIYGTNVGGIIGWYDGGTIDIVREGRNANYNVTVAGMNNVGGAVGLVTHDINDMITLDSEYWNFLNDTSSFATLSAGHVTRLSNWGGLFGLVSTDNLYLYEEDEESGAHNVQEIVNNNNINILNFTMNGISGSFSGTIENIGGVVGSFTGGNAIKLINNGDITGGSHDGYTGYNSTYDMYLMSNGGESVYSFKALNVGGVIGNAGNANLYALKNTGNVTGYQNVGGLVGYMSSGLLQSKIPDTIMGSNNTEIYLNNGDGSNDDVLYVQIQENANYTYAFEAVGEDITYYNLISKPTENWSEYYTLNEDAIAVESNVYGVVNVGGAVGLITGGTIDSIWSRAQVRGNANVGGLIGHATNTSQTNTIIRNNIVGANNSALSVKGVYFATYETAGVNNETNDWKYAIPTSVGGFIGSSVKTAQANALTITYNNVLNVNITSGSEGITSLNSDENSSAPVDPPSISTIENYMATTPVNETIDYTDTIDVIYDDDENDTIEDFYSVQSGFGGFIGSVNANSLYDGTTNLATTNNIDINVNAELGVNVGTFYGYYYYSNAIAELGSMILLPQLLDNVEVSGAYSVGGVIGYINQNITDFSNADIQFNEALNAESDTIDINVQNNGIGMYVGGLIGRLSGDGAGLRITSESSTDISINPNSSYYVGGLIGRLEGNLTHLRNADDSIQTLTSVAGLQTISELDTTTNFGGLVGMLKVAQGGTQDGDYYRREVTVEGEHRFNFTINTVENSNYADGTSSFTADTSNQDYINLIAQAYYVNLDTFRISPSYDVPSSNPLNRTAYNSDSSGSDTTEDRLAIEQGEITGWAKEYTTFRILQRNIPKEETGAEWDSIAVIYDAANITKVGTLGNLNLDPEVDDLALQPGKTAEDYTDDYIVYTIYEEMEGSPTLYSAIGIASPYYNEDGSYGFPSDTTHPWYEYLAAYTGFGSYPASTYYLNVANPINSNLNTEGLTYFLWNMSYGSFSTPNLGGNIGILDASEDQAIYLGYNVGYYDGRDNVYFIFDTIYHNTTIPDVQEAYLPPDGSIFNVNGANTTVAQKIINERTNSHSIGYYAAFVVTAIITVISFINPTAGIFNSTRRILKIVQKLVTVIRKVANLTFRFGKIAIKLQTVLLAVAAFNLGLAMSNQAVGEIHTQKLDQSFGFASQTYMRQIIYDDNMIRAEDMANIYYKGASYIYYSTSRPDDYGLKYYLYYDPLAQTTDIEEPTILNQDGINIQGDDGRRLTITDSANDNDPMIISELTYNNITYTPDTTADNFDASLMEIYYYYIYRNGVYYKIMDDASVTYAPTQMDDLIAEGDLIDSDGYSYVRGYYYAGENYYRPNPPSVVSGTYYNNNLTYNEYDERYEVNGVAWAEFENYITFGIQPSRDTGVTFKYDSAITSDDETNGEYITEGAVTYYRGYGYMKNAYYTANGIANQDDNTRKVAEFRWTTNPQEGIEGIDYIRVDYTITTPGVDENGEPIETQTPATGYYVIQEVMDSWTGDIYTYAQRENIPAEESSIYVYIYPFSFTNPYSVDITGTQDDNYYTVSSNSNISLSHTVTYFYYDGNYVQADDADNRVYMPIENRNSNGVNYYETARITIYNSDGDSQEVTYKKLIDGWNTYQNYYITNPNSLNDSDNQEGNQQSIETPKVSYQYKIVDGVLYELSASLVKQDGLLCTVIISTSDEQNVANYNYHKYLSDSNIGLYTRYKYITENLNSPQFSGNTESLQIFSGDDPNSEIDDYTFPTPSSGRTYYFTESVCITIGGGSVNLTFATGVDGDNRVEVTAGGVVVLG